MCEFSLLKSDLLHWVYIIIIKFSIVFTSDLAVKCSKVIGLTPAIICQRDVDLQELTEMYRGDLPSPELIEQEVLRWRHKYTSLPERERPDSCAKAIKLCDPDFFPNIFVLLQIACTIPVTSCECERSASVIRRLNNFMRASMTESRLTSLALIHANYDTEVDLDKVVNIFTHTNQLRMQLQSVFFTLRD